MKQNEIYDAESKYRDDHLKIYIDEVLKPIFPKSRIASAFTLGRADAINKYASIELPGSNDILKDSKYWLNKNRFIHYTSFKSLLEILNSKAIRMFDFNYLNDPNEFIYSAETLKLKFDRSYEYETLKETLFSLSMCLYNEKHHPDDFDMWRLYGQNGSGVGIVLNFNKSNKSLWQGHYLSKVYYKEKDFDSLSQLLERHRKFHENYDYRVLRFEETIYHLLGFHKKGIFKTETEVRLLRKIDKAPYEEHKRNDIFSYARDDFRRVNFTLLHLDSSEREEYFKGFEKYRTQIKQLFPKVKIDKVILGYKYSERDRMEIYDVVNSISTKALDYSIDVVSSSLKKHFPQ